MNTLTKTLLSFAALLAAGCGGQGPDPEPVAPGAPVDGTTGDRVLLVSIDGFRYDYLDPELTPNLADLARDGVRAEWMTPAFPTKTFPNHYTMVTGLLPDHHGLIANNIWDPEREARYGLSDREAVGDAEWYGGVPVWVTAERHGILTAPVFWPGSEAAIDGIRPTYWLPFDGDLPPADQVDWVLDRMEEGARFATLYFHTVDIAGHDHGPGAPETRTEIARVDSIFGLLRRQLEIRGLADVNVVVVSDHGMSRLSRDRVIFLDDYLDPEATRVIDWSPVLSLWPDPADVDSVYDVMAGAHPHLKIYRPEEIPDRYQYGSHYRVAPIVGIADPGWAITTRGYFARNTESFDGGTHGYDHRAPDMRALFIASGPAFREGVVVPAFPNVDVYEVVMAVLGLPPEAGDGRLERVEAMLAAD